MIFAVAIAHAAFGLANICDQSIYAAWSTTEFHLSVRTHHILPKGMAGTEEAQKALTRAGIDPFWGKENLMWGVKKGHTQDYANKVAAEILEAEREVISELTSLGIDLASEKARDILREKLVAVLREFSERWDLQQCDSELPELGYPIWI